MAKKKHIKPRASKKGLPPGSPIYIGANRTHTTSIERISYDESEIINEQNFSLSDLSALDSNKVHWLNINGIHENDVVERVCDHFKIHSLTIEDIMNTFQRPKSDEFEHYIFFTLRMLVITKDGLDINIDDEQISFILTNNVVISFQEKPGDVFDNVRDRLQDKTKRIRSKGADYLAFSLIDLIIDSYLEHIEYFNKETEDIESKILDTPKETHLNAIQDIKYELITLRKHIFPTREAIARLLRSESNLIKQDNIKYFNDLQDHMYQVVDQLDILRDLNANQREMYLSMISLKMNKVMEFLTILSSIFIPLTFIVGVYGMNFVNMPELSSKWGYPITWGVMLFITLLNILWFKKKNWL